jgi:hypothetical protein
MCLVWPRQAQAELYVRRYNSELIGRVYEKKQDTKRNRIIDERMRKGLIAAYDAFQGAIRRWDESVVCEKQEWRIVDRISKGIYEECASSTPMIVLRQIREVELNEGSIAELEFGVIWRKDKTVCLQMLMLEAFTSRPGVPTLPAMEQEGRARGQATMNRIKISRLPLTEE